MSWQEPVGVVDHHGAPGARKIEESFELGTNAGQILFEFLGGEHWPLALFAARVADQASATPDEADGAMPGPLQTHQEGDLEQAADMQARRRGVEADVSGHGVRWPEDL